MESGPSDAVRIDGQAHEKARLEHQAVIESEIGELQKAMQADVGKHAAVKSAPDVAMDANESARATELYSYIPRAQLEDLRRVLNEEVARGARANLRVLDMLGVELLERKKTVPDDQRDGHPVVELERRARNLRDAMRKGAPSLTESDVAKPHNARILAAEQRHRFFKRATGLDR